MASDSKKSNQSAGEGKRYCHRAHWLSTLGLLDACSVPEHWSHAASYSADKLAIHADALRNDLLAMACDCIDCRRPIPKVGDRNKHGERK